MIVYLHMRLFMMYLWSPVLLVTNHNQPFGLAATTSCPATGPTWSPSPFEASLETPDGLGSNMTTQRIDFGVEAMLWIAMPLLAGYRHGQPGIGSQRVEPWV